MLTKISLDYFPNGYSVTTGGSCIDLPIAVVAGNIKKSFYYTFLAAQYAYQYWCFDSVSWLKSATDTLSYLGVSLNIHKTNTWDSLLSVLKESIACQKPVLVPVSYHKLFYYLNYAGENKKTAHMLMITGYDEVDELLLIVDCNIVEHGLEVPNKEYALYQLPLTYQIFKEIWHESHFVFAELGNQMAYNSFNLSHEDFIDNLSDLDVCKKILTVIVDPALERGSTFFTFCIDEMQKASTNSCYTFNFNFTVLRRVALLQMTVLFDLFTKAIRPKFKKRLLYYKKSRFLSIRETVINRLIIDYQKKIPLSIETANLLKYEAVQSEKEIFNLVRRLL